MARSTGVGVGVGLGVGVGFLVGLGVGGVVGVVVGGVVGSSVGGSLAGAGVMMLGDAVSDGGSDAAAETAGVDTVTGIGVKVEVGATVVHAAHSNAAARRANRGNITDKPLMDWVDRENTCPLVRSGR